MRRVTRLTLGTVLLALLSACAATPPPAPTAVPPTVALAIGSAPTAAPPPTAAPATAAAPGQPPAADMWTPGNKLGVGTAFTYDALPGAANPSRVWFGLTNGAITEVMYPDVSQANVKSLGVLVSDGKSMLSDEMTDANYTVQRLSGAAPAFRITTTDTAGRWVVVKEVVTDPQANTVLLTVTFQALKGRAEDYHLYLQYTPRLAQSGAGDLSSVTDGIAEAWDEQAGIFSSLQSSPPPALITTGYTGQSDIKADLADFKVDATYNATTIPGRLTIGMELPTSGTTTVALGFGASRDEAKAAAAGSLARGFAAVAHAYIAGWASYLDGLPSPYPSLPLYSESLAALKTLEDKTNYGAFVASAAVPWGQYVPDTDARGGRGYRYVWPRDLYHIANALRLAGDERSARNVLAFMDERLQLPDGSFPQTAFPDGTPNTRGVQLDQTALPIVLAWQLKATDRYASLVQPAAEFLLRTGPSTPQDRWEEASGYSPATLAAEIAALVCAADLARQAGDAAAATRYLRTADEWNANIERWTLTTNGPLGGSYYLHISNGDPNSAAQLEIAHGGGTYDQRAIVDLSFLELVRLGVRAAKDPNVLATLAIVEQQLKAGTPKGEFYRRYTHDGYGESQPGRAPDGHGNLWPLLVGENSIYQIAQTGSEHPASWYLPTISGAANQGGMIPEQVFADGTGTGSATPLAWAHAEYVVFALAVKLERVPDTPSVVAERYAQQ
mgnify:CR=1 FL=1